MAESNQLDKSNIKVTVIIKCICHAGSGNKRNVGRHIVFIITWLYRQNSSYGWLRKHSSFMYIHLWLR